MTMLSTGLYGELTERERELAGILKTLGACLGSVYEASWGVRSGSRPVKVKEER